MAQYDPKYGYKIEKPKGPVYRPYRTFNDKRWMVVKAVIDGEEFGYSGDIIANDMVSRDHARFLANYLNGKVGKDGKRKVKS